MNSLLQEILNRNVEVRSQSGQHDYRDDGKLVAFDAQWIKLEKNNGEVLYLPIVNIRLVKPL